jgi:hypothetical protein
MAGDIKRFLVKPRAMRRLRPSAAAEASGCLRLRLESAGAGARDRLVPVGGGLAFYLRAGEEPVTVSLRADDAVIEPVGWGEATLAMLRRRFTRLRAGVVNFEGVEVFPRGPKKTTKRYRKHVRHARHTGMPVDGPMVREHPELIAGWPLGSDAAPAVRAAANPSVAVALHLYYVELWPEIETLLERWSFPFTLFLTLNRDNLELAARVNAAFPGAVIRVVDNRGRDVRPFLLLLEDGAFDAFDLVCKIHGKKSISAGRIAIFGDIVRRATFLDLIATDAQALKIVQMFRDDPQIGLVGPRRFRAVSDGEMQRDLLGRNRRTAEAIAARMGSAIRDDAFDFFSGTMFWARPQALAPLQRLRLSEDFAAPEAGLVDGALEHAVERLFNHAARAAGFRVADVTVES